MAPKITVKEDYILVEPKEVDYWEILEGIVQVLNLPEFSEKNDIWLFNNVPIKLAYDDLYKFKDHLEEIYPENENGNKTAIVVDSGVQEALALFFIQIAKDLPFEINVFSDLKTAEDWIRKK